MHSIASLLALLLSTGASIPGDQPIRVGLFHQRLADRVYVAAPDGLRVKSGKRHGTERLLRRPSPSAHCLRYRSGGFEVERAPAKWTRLGASPVLLQSAGEAPLAAGITPTALTPYPGLLELAGYRGRLRVVNVVGLEDYTAAVLSAEVPGSWPQEALRALAVAIRTFAVASCGRHEADGFDVCSYAHCQAYHGLEAVTEAAREATVATQGLILTYRGRPIEALHHACCGGHTTTSAAAWSGARDLPYLRGISDEQAGRAFCRDAPEFSWSTEIPAAQLLATLQAQPATNPGKKLDRVTVRRRDASGRAVSLTLQGGKRRTVTAADFWSAVRQSLGWHAVPSTWFEVSRQGDAFRFEGHGFGHGVGLCQWGARGRALAGWNYEQILAAYYPGTRLKSHHSR